MTFHGNNRLFDDVAALEGETGVSQVVGPFTVTSVNADAGVPLFTPAVGDRIIGMWVEATEAFDVSGEQFGIGIAGTTDADLAMKINAPVVPSSKPTFTRGQGSGFPFGTEVIRLTSTAPLLYRSVIGGNATGAMTVWLRIIPAAAFG